MPVDRRTVLISGAGVAGPVLAHWLHRFGFRPTVVERAPQMRAGGGGHAVDLFGPAVDIMNWMGVLDQVESARTTTEVVALIRPGRSPIEVPAEMASEGVSERHIEILRGDLAQIVWNTTSDTIEYVFGDSITAVTGTGDRVQVSFERGRSRTFDLLIGADGLHSITRHLVFGPEESFTRFLGGYLAVFTVPNDLQLRNRMVTFAAPGRTTALYPVGDASQARVLLLWRTPRLHNYDRHDPVAQRRLIRSMYADLGWEVPRLLDRLDRADDLYLDSISQVIMPSWTQGRIALVGDAGYCPGPAVGGGTSLALIGAYSLASELARADGDPGRAFTAYQRAMEPVVAHSRAIGPAAIRLIIPQSGAQIWTMAQAMRAIPRLPGPLRRKITAWGGNVTGMLDTARLTPPDQLPHSR